MAKKKLAAKPNLKIESVAIADPIPDPENARRHDSRNVESIAASLKEFGQATPISIDAANVVLKGNGTLLADKQLMGIPWRVALALQDDGWMLRQEIIWQKKSPMPESVKDRCCRAHEHIFVLAKSRRYFWDHVGMFEPTTGGAHMRRKSGEASGSAKEMPMDAPMRGKYNADYNAAVNALTSQRTARSVWTFASEGTTEKHFAAYPTALVHRCLKAGVSPAGACPACFAPRRRIIKKVRVATRPGTNSKVRFPHNWAAGPGRHSEIEFDVEAVRRSGRASQHEDSPANDHRGSVVGNRDPYRHISHIETIGWEPSCKCEETGSVGCLVLDPFSGTATTGRVAVAMGHCYIGIDLSEDYTAIAHRNIARGWKPKEAKKRKEPEPRAPDDRQGRFLLTED